MHPSETNDTVMLMGILERFGIEELLEVYRRTVDAYIQFRKPNAVLRDILIETSIELGKVKRRIDARIHEVEHAADVNDTPRRR